VYQSRLSELSTASVDVVQTGSITSKSPYILIGLPDAGLVGTIAASYLVDYLNMNELGYIDSAKFPPMIIVKNNEVKNVIRMYEKDNLVVVISDIPIISYVAVQFAKSLIGLAKKLSPKLVVNVTGLPVQNRLEIQKPEVVGLATSKEAIELLRSAKVALFSDGVLFGTYAAVIKECVLQNIPSLTLFAQSHFSFPDPIASIEALSVVNKVLNTNIDLKPLKEEAEIIRIKTRELMRQTEGTLKEARIGSPQTMYR
jgi:uncharacterized protein